MPSTAPAISSASVCQQSDCGSNATPHRADAGGAARSAVRVSEGRWSGSGSHASLALGATAVDPGMRVSDAYLARRAPCLPSTPALQGPMPNPQYVSEMKSWFASHPAAALIVSSCRAWQAGICGEPHAANDHLILAFLLAYQTPTRDAQSPKGREWESTAWEAHGILGALAGVIRKEIQNNTLHPEVRHAFRWYDRCAPDGPDNRQLRIDEKVITLVERESEIVLAARNRGTNVGGCRTGLFPLKDAAQNRELLTWGRALTRIDLDPAKDKTANWCYLPFFASHITPTVFKQLLQCLARTGETGSLLARAMTDKLIHELCSREGLLLPEVSRPERNRAREAVSFAYQRGALLQEIFK